jgi:periplasmic protein TonB
MLASGWRKGFAMPRELFVDSLTSRPVCPRSGWTLLGSLVTHLVLLIVLVVLPLTAAVDNPVVAREVIGFVPPTPPTPPPVTPPSRPRTAAAPINPNAAPPAPGTVIAPEKPAETSGAEGVRDLPVTVGRPPDGAFGNSLPTLTAPPPAILKPVPVGGNVREPRRITYVPPVYPVIAQTAKVEGLVILEAVIDETGAVRNVRVLRSIPLLDRAAIDAVSRWRYLPTQLNGVAVPVIMTVSVSFTLR